MSYIRGLEPFWGYVKTVPSAITRTIYVGWTENQHIQYHYQRFMHDATDGVYKHASSCLVMYATCWCAL
jgi:hypothetical protein